MEPIHLNSLISAVVTLILVLDPFGNIPAVIAILPQTNPSRRRFFIFRETCIATGLLFLCMFFGKGFLSLIHLQQHALQISGGIILFIIAFGLIFPKQMNNTDLSKQPNADEEPFIFPLAVPLLAGPSSMVTVMLTSSHTFLNSLALIISMGISMIILFSSEIIYKRLGTATMNAIVRLMGLLLSTISVQMILSGIRGFVLNI